MFGQECAKNVKDIVDDLQMDVKLADHVHAVEP
jgi:hypothetical protein